MIQVLEVSCSNAGLGTALSAMKKLINLIQIIVPILLIIGMSIHIMELMKNPDDAKRKKKVFNSLIAAAVVFFIPMFVDVVMNMVGDSTTFSACWNSASNSGTATDYVDPYNGKEKSGFITDPKDYEKGNPSLPSQVGDSKYNKYQTLASCESETLKYKIIRVSNHADLAIIWVKNPVKQFKLALAAANSYGRLAAEQILSNEISSNGLQRKCLVAVNASFFSYSDNSPVSGVVIHNGQIVKNKGNASGCIGVNGKGKLIECSHQSASSIVSSGVKNTFGISSKAGMDNSGKTANRTQVCQIDQNNFVLFSGDGTVGGCAQVTNAVTGCADSYNLDGGGSRKLYYKTQSSGVTKIFGGGRTIPDMLYFSEQ